MFGRATIRLGIGPHFSILFAFLVLLLIFYFIYLLTLLALSKKLVQLQKCGPTNYTSVRIVQ